MERESRDFLINVIRPALKSLPEKMRGEEAEIQLLFTALQESELKNRKQMGNGPARSFFQFEKIAIKEVLQNPKTADIARRRCADDFVSSSEVYDYFGLPAGDILSAIFARLNYWLSPLPMPHPGPRAIDDACGMYLLTWRPGKPQPATFSRNYWIARTVVKLTP